jgi:zinc transport system substrate-binding protein
VVVETTRDVDLLDADGTDHDHGDDGDDHGGSDPHTWISPHVALQQAEAVYDALVEADPDNAGDYATRWEDLRQRLEDLDARYSEGLNDTEHGVIIVTHAAFGYLANRYGFEQHGVIGLSADEQPSAAAIADLADEMVELGIFTVFIDPVYSDDYARTLQSEVERETGETVATLELYFMAGVVNGLDYMDQMERNLANLQEGLGAREGG